MASSTESSSPPLHAIHPVLGVADQVERVARSVVALPAHHRRGAVCGVVWQPGIVVTSAAALAQVRRLIAVSGESQVHEDAELVGVDPETDIAALRVASLEAPLVERAADTSATARVGDFVFAAGRDTGGAVQASFGHIGSVSPGPWRTWRGGRFERRVRLDGGLYPGFEGSALADAQGRVLGLATSALSRVHGVVIPAETVDRVLGELLAHGQVQRPYLGILVQPARTVLHGDGGEAAQRSRIDGVLVSSVADGGPADGAGLLVGDVIVDLDGEAVATAEELQHRLQGAEPGRELSIGIARGGRRESLQVTVGVKPAAAPPSHRACTP